MASSFPALVVNQDPLGTLVREYTVLDSVAFIPGELVFLDTGDNTVKTCGANPAAILGLALSPNPASMVKGSPYSPGTIPIQTLDNDSIVAMSSSTTPAVSHLFRKYGVAKSTYWQVNTSDTSNTRVVVVGIDITNGVFFVRFLTANLQAVG